MKFQLVPECLQGYWWFLWNFEKFWILNPGIPTRYLFLLLFFDLSSTFVHQTDYQWRLLFHLWNPQRLKIEAKFKIEVYMLTWHDISRGFKLTWHDMACCFKLTWRVTLLWVDMTWHYILFTAVCSTYNCHLTGTFKFVIFFNCTLRVFRFYTQKDWNIFRFD